MALNKLPEQPSDHLPVSATSWSVRQFLQRTKWAVALAVLGCTGNGNVEQPQHADRIADVRPEAKEGHHDEHAEVRFPPGVLAKLANDEAAHEEIARIGLRRYFDHLHAKEALVAAEKSVMRVIMRCVDERQSGNRAEPYKEKEGHGIAGVGILATDEELAGIARDAVSIAQEKSEERHEAVTIVVQPHLQKKCGAATLALNNWNSKKKDGEKDTGPDAVDRAAMKGAERTKAALEKAVEDLRAERVKVVVEPFDQENFLQGYPDHPASIVFINRCKGKVATMSTKEGPFWYNVTGAIGSKAEFDAVLSATIAKSSHGMHAGSKGAPKNRPIRFAIAVDSEEEGKRFQAELQGTLSQHEQFGPMLREGKALVEYWVPDQPATTEHR